MADDEQLIDDQFQLAVCIASGSSSQVWEVIEKSSARHIAMKLLKSDAPDFKENKATMKRESEIHKTLDHPQIIKFERFSSNRDHTYILMEYFRASNLKLQIKADTNGVHLKIRQLFEGICSSLAYVHSKGIVHRDIKPDNILMNKVGEVRLCDFSLSSKQVTGISKLLSGKLKAIQGTRTYIAPETIRKQQPTFQTDMYSLGVLFFEVLACKTPFQAPTPEELLQKHLRAEPPNPSEFNPNISPEMDRIIARLLKKKPADRPASVDEVLAEIRRIRIFKEEIVDAVAEKKANEDKDALEMLSEVRLDSRADAKLKEMLATNPEFARKFQDEKTKKASVKKADTERQNERIKTAETVEAARAKPGKTAKAAPAAAPAQQPVQMMPMPMQMPGYPPGYPQGYPQYPAGFPGYPQGQMPMPPGMAQSMPGGPQQYVPQPQMAQPQPIPLQPSPPQQRPQAAVAGPPQAAVQQPNPSAPQPKPQMAVAAAPQPQVQRPPQANSPQIAGAGGGGKAQQAQPQKPPVAAAPAKSAAPSKPAGSVRAPVPGRPEPRIPTPPPGSEGLDFMTDLPDVL
jgi:serine/threonine protein kinase